MTPPSPLMASTALACFYRTVEQRTPHGVSAVTQRVIESSETR